MLLVPLLVLTTVVHADKYKIRNQLFKDNYNSIGLLEPNEYNETTESVFWWGGNQDERSPLAATDSEGNLYITCFSDSFGSTSRNIHLLKFDDKMNLEWNVSWLTNDDAQPADMVIDKNNNIYITGTIITNAINHDVFLLKYQPDKTRLWNFTYITPSTEDDPGCLAVDSFGDIFVVGHTNSSQGAMFINKYNSEGVFQWDRYYGTISPREEIIAAGMRMEKNNQFVVAATTDNSSPPTNLDDLVLVKFNATGFAQWNVTFGSANPQDRGFDVEIVDNDYYVVGNYFSGGSIDAVIVKIDQEGNYLWNVTYSQGIDEGIAITSNHYGNLVITGTTDSNDPSGDMFVYEIDRLGNHKWNSSYDGGQADQANDVCTFNEKLYSVSRSLNVTSGYDITIVQYLDTDAPSENIPIDNRRLGEILAYIIAIPLVVVSVLLIGYILYTYFTKEEEQ
jgi:hypothetical protein